MSSLYQSDPIELLANAIVSAIMAIFSFFVSIFITLTYIQAPGYNLFYNDLDKYTFVARMFFWIILKM